MANVSIGEGEEGDADQEPSLATKWREREKCVHNYVIKFQKTLWQTEHLVCLSESTNMSVYKHMCTYSPSKDIKEKIA